MASAIQSGSLAQEHSSDQHEKAGSGLVKWLEEHATTILVLAVALSAIMLLDAYTSISGSFLTTSAQDSGLAQTTKASSALETSSLSVVGLQLQMTGWFPAYSFKTLVVIAHVLALVMSFGTVMFLDLFLLRYLLFRPVPAHAYEVASIGSRLVWAGLAIMWLTGLTFLLIYWVVDPIKLDNPKIWTKVIVVSLLSVNGMLIHNHILPMLKFKVGRKILEGESTVKAKLILATGAVSFTSWTFAVVLGLSKELNFTVSSVSLLLAYALSNALVFVGMNGLVSVFGKRPSSPPPPQQVHNPPKALILGASLRTLL